MQIAYMCVCVGPVLHIHFVCVTTGLLRLRGGQDCFIFSPCMVSEKRKKDQDTHKVLIISSNFKLWKKKKKKSLLKSPGDFTES
jgi:hypothetical protein